MSRIVLAGGCRRPSLTVAQAAACSLLLTTATRKSMTSFVARGSLALASACRKLGAALDSMGKQMEVTKYTEKLVPSTRFVAVEGVGAPRVNEMSFVAPTASVVGDVIVGKESSVWYGAVLRGDVNKLTVGDQSSIGDRAVVHVAKIQGDFATSIGNLVTIGAGAIIHAATIHDKVIVGESAQVLDGAVVESNSIIEPGAIVTPGTVVKGGELWSGSPAKKVRALTEEEIDTITVTAKDVLVLASKHATENAKDYAEVQEDELKADIEEYMDPTMLQPQGIYRDPAAVLDQGHPGRVFRSTLSHPQDLYPKGYNKEEAKANNP